MGSGRNDYAGGRKVTEKETDEWEDNLCIGKSV